MEDKRLVDAREIIDETDKAMAELFCRRMKAAKLVAEYKMEHGLPIKDVAREDAIISRNRQYVSDEDEAVRSCYARFMREMIDLSCSYQEHLYGNVDTAFSGNGGDVANVFANKDFTDEVLDQFKTKIHLSLESCEYDIVIERGCITSAAKLLDLDRKVLVVTDDGVPEEYSKTVANMCGDAYITVLPAGESTKSFDQYIRLCEQMLANGFTRTDCVVAVGGGVVGDLAGFAAATYMRGIDFYNIPTTLLSQVDSSVGGKTGIDVGDMKNIVGAFKQPKRVLVDPDLLKTLPERHIANGLAEALKMALTCDKEAFELFNNEMTDSNLDKIIEKSILIKSDIVRRDEKENSLRRVLNFGHTVGHGIETASGLTLLHGECVGLGMLPMCSDKVRDSLLPVLKKLGLPVFADIDKEKVIAAIFHDKKKSGNYITGVYVNEIGTFELKKEPFSEFENRIREVL